MEIQNLFAQRIGGKEFGINNKIYVFNDTIDKKNH